MKYICIRNQDKSFWCEYEFVEWSIIYFWAKGIVELNKQNWIKETNLLTYYYSKIIGWIIAQHSSLERWNILKFHSSLAIVPVFHKRLEMKNAVNREAWYILADCGSTSTAWSKTRRKTFQQHMLTTHSRRLIFSYFSKCAPIRHQGNGIELLV